MCGCMSTQRLCTADHVVHAQRFGSNRLRGMNDACICMCVCIAAHMAVHEGRISIICMTHDVFGVVLANLSTFVSCFVVQNVHSSSAL
jgi:hypothetical protein